MMNQKITIRTEEHKDYKSIVSLILRSFQEIYDIEDIKHLVIGGAYSVDKKYRIARGYGWWENEQPSDEIKAYVESQIDKHGFDVILSHTCPLKYEPIEMFLSMIDQSTVDKSTEVWLKDDVLLVSYVNKIEKLHNDQSLPTYRCYRGYDEEISGSAIITILSGAKKYSNYNLKPIKKLMEHQWEWLKEQYPNDYKEGEWQFDFDKAISEAYVNYKSKKKV